MVYLSTLVGLATLGMLLVAGYSAVHVVEEGDLEALLVSGEM